MENSNIAVLIDFENIAAGVEKEGLGKLDIGLIMNRLRERGRVLVARSYADWGRFARFKKDLLFEGISLFELSAHGMNDKNRADVALVVDCMELAFGKNYIDTFVVVSGDSDFTPLIVKLRELNKRVVGCGTRKSTSRLIVEACDEFLFYDTLRAVKTQRTRRGRADSSNQLSREEAMELVTEALDSLLREDPIPVHSSKLKEAILKKEPAFSEDDLGFGSLTRFLEYCQRQGILRIEKDNRAGGVLVSAPDAEPGPVEAEKATANIGGEAKRFYELLTTEDLEPLTRDQRRKVCELVVESANDRSSGNKRMNLQWVIQDVVRKTKPSDPALNTRRVKGVVNALHRAGVFLHSDGEPVRSFFASFALTKTAPELVAILDLVYIRRLREQGVDVPRRLPDIADLLFNDRTRTRDIEEILAWEQVAVQPDEESGGREQREERGEGEEGDEAPRPARNGEGRTRSNGEGRARPNGEGRAQPNGEERDGRGRRGRRDRPDRPDRPERRERRDGRETAEGESAQTGEAARPEREPELNFDPPAAEPQAQEPELPIAAEDALATEGGEEGEGKPRRRRARRK